jgi:hypothetical protein
MFSEGSIALFRARLTRFRFSLDSGHIAAAPVPAVAATTRRASSRSADLRWKGRKMQMGRHAVYP